MQIIHPADNTMVGTNPFGGFKNGGSLQKAQDGIKDYFLAYLNVLYYD